MITGPQESSADRPRPLAAIRARISRSDQDLARNQGAHRGKNLRLEPCAVLDRTDMGVAATKAALMPAMPPHRAPAAPGDGRQREWRLGPPLSNRPPPSAVPRSRDRSLAPGMRHPKCNLCHSVETPSRGPVLAHRRDDDAIRQGNATKPSGSEQMQRQGSSSSYEKFRLDRFRPHPMPTWRVHVDLLTRHSVPLRATSHNFHRTTIN